MCTKNFLSCSILGWKSFLFCLLVSSIGCVPSPDSDQEDNEGHSLETTAKTADGQYISWREHIIDDPKIGGVPISGGDGLVMADLDQDGYQDIVSVHESDTEYDGVADGYIRLAFGSEDPNHWILATLAVGEEAAAPEDVAVADVNGDGFLDIIGACELAHLIYFQNPGVDIRTAKWERLIPPITKDRGSFIRVFFADFNEDGVPEVTAANKGSQAGNPADSEPTPISWYEITGDPLNAANWVERELTKVNVPINAEPFDLDQDGDLDIIAGSRGERRIFWFENKGGSDISFHEHEIRVGNPSQHEFGHVTGFNMDYYDFNKDGRMDIVVMDWINRSLIWLEQPTDFSADWPLHLIGHMRPDQPVGFTLADINGDQLPDIMAGSYSQGLRDRDGGGTIDKPAGRLSWFEQPRDLTQPWIRHDISRRKRGMFDKFVALDLDRDGDMDFVSTRGNSIPFDGVFWLEQIRSKNKSTAFRPARKVDSQELPIPRD